MSQEAASRPSISRKMTPIRRADGEAFTRQDIQFDFLNHVFSDESKVFTDPYSQDQSYSRLTFGELYVGTLLQSSKCSKALRDKMLESPPFALDFAKLALLANVGRINSTQACEPTLKVLCLFTDRNS
jgi:Ino eighty subunit 1